MVINPLQSAMVGLTIHASQAVATARSVADPTIPPAAPSTIPQDLSAPISDPPPAPTPAMRGWPPAALTAPAYDPVRDSVQLLVARQGYNADTTVLLTQDSMLGSVIDLIA